MWDSEQSMLVVETLIKWIFKVPFYNNLLPQTKSPFFLFSHDAAVVKKDQTDIA